MNITSVIGNYIDAPSVFDVIFMVFLENHGNIAEFADKLGLT
ncbi:hypothetical protein Nos7524_0545 [Nostoc sp. PCC 7524]|nr:hypothetical protein [Nostoc sp. PCC 7524]AFY46456.1 hypothetical protein Nos7524_0545 [Nostoc sp. PCC 7524]